MGAVSFAAATIATLAGAFGSHALALAPRGLFWLLAIMPVWLAWELWFGFWLRRALAWVRILLSGFALMLALLPAWILVLLELFGLEPASVGAIFLRAGGIALVLLPLAYVFLGRSAQAALAAPAGIERFDGTLIRKDEIAAILAEDHYVRLHLANGENRLLHRRFADAVALMTSFAGEQVHRGAWLADAHRGQAFRQSERWFIRVNADLAVPVSRSRVAQLRERGWLVRE